MVIHASVLVVLVSVKVACIWLSGKMLNCVYYSQHSFGLPLRMYGMHGTQFDHARLDLLSLVLMTRVLTFPHAKLTQTTLEHSDGAKAF